MSDAEDLIKVHEYISNRLLEIGAIFTVAPKITLVIRHDGIDNQDMVLSNDSTKMAIETITRLDKKKRGI